MTINIDNVAQLHRGGCERLRRQMRAKSCYGLRYHSLGCGAHVAIAVIASARVAKHVAGIVILSTGGNQAPTDLYYMGMGFTTIRFPY